MRGLARVGYGDLYRVDSVGHRNILGNGRSNVRARRVPNVKSVQERSG